MATDMSEAMIKQELGPMLLGILLNTYLYGIGCFQYASYVSTKFKDPLWMKGTVLLLFTLDSLHSLGLIWLLWFFFVERFNDPSSLLDTVWPYPLTIAVTALIAFSTQSFLSYRVYRLKKNVLWIAIIIPAALGGLAFALYTTYKSWHLGVSEYGQVGGYIGAWLSIEMSLDILICGSLLYRLSQSRTGFAKTDSVISRLMRAAIQTGTFAGIFSAITLILFFKSSTQLYTLPGFPISRLYSNTLMDTILCRGELRELMQGGESGHLSLGSTRSGKTSIQMHVQREVHFDTVSGETSSVSSKPRTRAWSIANDQVDSPVSLHYLPRVQPSYSTQDTHETKP